MLSTIAISYTTYNRPKIFQSNILIILPILKKYNIPLYISDDSDNNDTEIIIIEIKNLYNNIFYNKNIIRLGHDLNFYKAITIPKEEYVWYLGDSIYFNINKFELILKNLNSNFDLIFLNSIHPDNDTYEITNKKLFFISKIWYLTLSGSCIYGRKARMFQVDSNIINKWANFVQLGQILKYSISSKAKMLWIGEPLIASNDNKKSYWQKNIVKVFIYDWFNFIFYFNTYFNLEETLFIIKSHAIEKKLFTLKSIFYIRSLNGLRTSEIFKYYRELKIASNYNVLQLFLFSIIPSLFFKIFYRTYKKIKH
jgi:hypothetical protein